MKPEPIEEFPPVPNELLWMFNRSDRKEATKMIHDYVRSSITWKPSKALLRAWEDVQNATDMARRLEDELKNRDKCSFIGPMRDCPTHGDSTELAALRELCRQLYQAEQTKNQQDLTAVICALEKVGADTTAT